MRHEQSVSLPELMRWALAERAEQELSDMPSPQELQSMLGDLPELRRRVFSDLEGQQKSRSRRPLRVLVRALIVAAVLVSILACMMMASAAVRGAVVNTIIDWTNRDVGIRFEVEGEPLSALPEGYAPHYIPEGMVCMEEVSWKSKTGFMYAYQSEDGATVLDIQVGIAENSSMYRIDNEHIIYDKITFNGVQAYLGTFEESRGYVMLWMKDGIEHMIYICGEGVTLSEVCAIAENIY